MNKADLIKAEEKDTPKKTIDIVHAGLSKRYRAERRFKLYGLAAIILSLLCLAILFISIVGSGYTAFQQTFIQLEVFFDPAVLGQENLSSADYPGLVKGTLRSMFPEVKGRRDKRALYKLVSPGAAFQLREMVLKDPGLVGKTVSVWVPADDDVDMLVKEHFDRNVSESGRRLNNKQLAWFDELSRQGKIEKRFNKIFFTAGDSREPELAGIGGAASGTFFTLVVTLILSFPIGVAAAVYLEEFAPKNRWTDLIEVNINNLQFSSISSDSPVRLHSSVALS